MAVDTATKRYAMINFGAADLMMPVPDGTVAAVDRSHFLGMYLAGGAAITFGEISDYVITLKTTRTLAATKTTRTLVTSKTKRTLVAN